MHSRWARVARGFTASAAATFVAAVSHSLSGGAAPSWLGVAASFTISAMACTLLAGRTISLWRLALSIGFSQFLFHTLFSSLGTPTAVAHTMSVTIPDAPAHAHASPTMWAAHSVAAIVTLVAFRFGEQAFWGVVATARFLLARILVVVVPTLGISRPVDVVECRFLPRDLALFLSSMRHRGPPVELLA